MKSYADKLKDPRWQKRRLEILERDDFTCRSCHSKEKTLHVHHACYEKGMNPWEYPNEDLSTQCEDCHRKIERLMKIIARNLGSSEPRLNMLAYISRLLVIDQENAYGFLPWAGEFLAALVRSHNEWRGEHPEFSKEDALCQFREDVKEMVSGLHRELFRMERGGDF